VRSPLSDNAFSVLLPIFQQVLRMRTPEIRALIESQGMILHDWERARTDRVQISEPIISSASDLSDLPQQVI
jgi:hypothetical protein